MRRPLLWVCLCLVMLIAVGHYAGAPPVDAPPDGQSITVTGRIYQKNETSFYLKIQSVAAASRQEDSRTYLDFKHQIFSEDRLICEYENAEDLRLGSVVALQGSFDGFSAATNPGEFDYRKYYHSLGFAGRVREAEILGCGEKYSRVLELLHRLKRYWKGRLYRIFPEKEASVMTAVLLGDKSGLDSDIKELYQSNGVIHILSISGLHITIIGLGLYRLLRRLGMPVWPAAICGGVALSLYGVLTGLSVSACRAIGMYLLRMLSFLCGRTYDMLTALGLMAALLALSNPGYLEHMGFLLSFASILGVGVLCPALAPGREAPPVQGASGPVPSVPESVEPVPRQKRRESRLRGGGPNLSALRYREGRLERLVNALWEKLRDTVAQGLLAGLSITLTTLPIQLWFSYEVPVFSVFLNILILPFMGVVMTAGLIAMLVPGLGVVGTVDILILGGYEGLCELFAKLPFHTWNPGRPQLWQVILYYVLWLVVVLGTEVYRQMRKRESGAPERLSGAVRLPRALRQRMLLRPDIVLGSKIALLTIAVVVLGCSFSRGDRITFLDVGQGDCICVRSSRGEVYLFDCGSSNRGRIGEKVLIPFLKYYGISHVDGVFLSHPDADHINGLLELFALGGREHITVDRVILPGIAEAKREEEWGEILAAVRAATQRKPIEIYYVQAGDSLWGTAETTGKTQGTFQATTQFLCLHPAADFSAADSNACSTCFYMKFENGFSMLLTGDVEGAGEAALLEQLRQREISGVTLLKVAHHGSRNSTSEELLRQVSPSAAVISCGRNNRYGHPHEELLERLREAGAGARHTDGGDAGAPGKSGEADADTSATLGETGAGAAPEVFRTDESGAITVLLKGRQVIVQRFCGGGGSDTEYRQ